MAKKILTEADAIPGRGGNTSTTSAGKSFINTVVAKMPFSFQVIDNITALNPKYEVFSKISSSRDTRVAQQSVFKSDPNDSDLGSGSMLVDKNYQQFMYANLDLDKVKRLQDYRKMATYSTLNDCLDEICDDIFEEDKDDDIVKLKLKGEYSKTIEDEVTKEWKKFIDLFELDEKGIMYTRNLMVDGELFFENAISQEHPEYGIIGVVGIPTELINPFYKNAHNNIIEGFALRKPQINPQTDRIDKEELIIFQTNQVTYIHSGKWNEDCTMRLPYIENARRAYKQLSLVEDSIVIYRLVRAPERMAFHVDVGNLSPPKAEAYIKKLMQQYWAKKTFDTTTGRITNVYDPQSMLDSYWFPKRAGTEGTRVERLEGGCLAMNTLIPLLDGRELTLSEMTNEFQEGKQNWIYSCDPKTGRIVPGKVSWAGVTQKSANVMELTFDNGKTLICTPDHKFPILERGKVEARELKIGDSLIPFNTRYEKIGNGDYHQIYQNETKEWQFTHRLVAKEMKQFNLIESDELNPKSRTVIHHKDCNRYNNNPDNLKYMNHKDHIKYHASFGFPNGVGTIAARDKFLYIKENYPEQYEEFCKLISNRTKNYWDNLSEDQYEKHVNQIKKKIKKYIASLTDEKKEQRAAISRNNFLVGTRKHQLKMQTDDVYRDSFLSKQSDGYKNFKGTERYNEFCTKLSHRNIKNYANPEYKEKVFKNQRIKCDKVILDKVVDIVKGKTTHEVTINDVVDILNSTPSILSHFTEINKDTKSPNWTDGKIHFTHLKNMVKKYGYENWKHFRQEINQYNHRIVDIKYIQDPIEVGTLTIDKNEEYHNHHTFALSCGVMTYNSNLGQLDDLLYFLRALYKSMRVPVGRINPEDAFKDGTEMTREEIRFGKFLEGIQRQFSAGLKASFITHLKLRNIWSNYNLKERHLKVIFNTPTMFMMMKQQQMFELKYNNFNNLSQNEGISNSFAQKEWLELTDEEMAVNREWRRKDAAMQYELEQILTNGPNWKQQVAAMQDIEAQMGAGGGGGAMGGVETPPDFGPAPEAGEAAPEAGGAAPQTPAPAAGGAGPAPASAPATPAQPPK